jgi:hypothetical protein
VTDEEVRDRREWHQHMMRENGMTRDALERLEMAVDQHPTLFRRLFLAFSHKAMRWLDREEEKARRAARETYGK